MRCLFLIVGMLMSFAVEAKPFAVVKSEKAKSWENTAATELKNYLRRVARGGQVSVDGQDATFYVGDTPFAAEKGLWSTNFAEEAWAVKSFGGAVVLNGGGTRGALYAVYSFLEEQCDIHWWNDGDEDVPAAKPLAFPALSMQGKPFFPYRDIYRANTSSPSTAVRNRLNGNGDSAIPLELGGGFVYGPPYHCHCWERRLPYEAYKVKHPEWFSLRDGQRVGGMTEGQLCLSNAELLEYMTDLVRADIARGESWASWGGSKIKPRIYDSSMNDNRCYCTCDKCREEVARYGFSGQMIRFLNEMARKINRPDLYFATSAYHYSEPVPTGGMVADDNIVIKLALTCMNMAAPLTDPCNADSLHKLTEWKKYCKNIFIHEYGTTFTKDTRGFPYPSEFTLAEKYRLYADNCVRGHLIEHEPDTLPDMFELKFHMECKLLENPYRDATDMIPNFLRKYYGAAGDKIYAARLLLKRLRDAAGANVSYFPNMGDFNFITTEGLAEASRLFDEAAAAVQGDAKLTRRVAKARESLDLVANVRKKFGQKHAPEAGVSDKPFFDFPVTRNTYYVYRKALGTFVTFENEPGLGDVRAGGATVIRIDRKQLPCPFTMSLTTFPKGIEMPSERLFRRERFVPQGDGYAWYDLGTADIPKHLTIVYFTDYVQFRRLCYGVSGTRQKVRALMKITDDEIRLARLIFVEP